eukprot:TRINITY_DN26108_c0_g5_i1.p1 TRINITY_DN26108_c0_g5~~TRINITY_DN26108_c0_g5_i1.p1  ORF type:complete len:1079 (-),score=273.42 TRINITY_DN26108_c0_g5_i1:117-3332(-)
MQAEPDVLYRIFRHSYSARAEERQQAEVWLQQAEGSKGLLLALLQIAAASPVEVPIRQAASIQLKNQIRKGWISSGDEAGSSRCYSLEDKASLRAQLLEGVAGAAAVPTVRAQLVECFRLVALNDFPENWAGLVDSIVAGLQSDDMAQTLCGLLLLRKLFKQLEMRPVARREDLERLCSQTLPTLLKLAPALAAAKAFEMLRLVLKCFHSAIFTAIGPQVQKDLEGWMWIVLEVAAFSLGPTLTAAEEQARESSQDVKCKKWAFHILYRFFHRHGHRRRAVEGMEDFADAWSEKYEVSVCEVCLKEACARHRGTWAPKRSLSIALLCLADACSNSREAAYEALRPGLQHLLQFGIFPQVRFGERDLLLWREDPEEYLRELLSDFDTDSNPRAAAVELVERLLLFRKNEVMLPLLQFCLQHLEAQTQNPGDPELCSNKEGALMLIGVMAEELVELDPAQSEDGKAKKKKKGQKSKSRSNQSFSVEELLARHVRPTLSSPVAFLRLRACWVYRQIASKALKLGPAGAAGTACRECLQLVADPELPVRVMAATCLEAFLEREEDEEVRAIVAENLAAVLEQLLRVLSEVQCEEVAETLQTLIENFPREIVPFASRLIAQLANQFCQTLSASKDDDEAEGVAMGSLATIVSVLQACAGLQNQEDAAEKQRRAGLFAGFAETLLPLVSRLLHPDGIDYLDEGLEMLGYLTGFCETPIPAQIWMPFPRLYQAVCGKPTPSLPLPDVLKDGWAPDFMTNLLEPLLNYIARGPPAAFLGSSWAEVGMSYPDMIFDMVKKVLHTPGIGAEKDGEASVELASALFEFTTSPAVDNWLPRYFNELWTRMSSVETSDLRRAILLTFATMIWYNAELFLRCAEEKGCTAQIFEVWAQKISTIRRLKDRKVMLLGKTRLLQLGCAQGLPQTVAQGLPHVVRMLGQQTQEIIRLRQKQDAGGLDEEDDSASEADEESKEQQLQKVLGKLEMAQDESGDDNSEDDDDEEFGDFMDGQTASLQEMQAQRASPLQRLDELDVLRQTIQQAPTAMQQQMESWLGVALQQWVTELSSEVSRRAEVNRGKMS